jgi:hypothetical protein
MVYIRLFHGRDTPEENLEDWGFDGPVLGPLNWVQTTYRSHIKIGFEGDWIADLEYVEDLVYYDGKLYGDWSVFFAEPVDGKVAGFVPEAPVPDKFKVPPELRARYPA